MFVDLPLSASDPSTIMYFSTAHGLDEALSISEGWKIL
jgi:hypothetical protein